MDDDRVLFGDEWRKKVWLACGAMASAGERGKAHRQREGVERSVPAPAELGRLRERGRGVRPIESAEACWTKELREGVRVGFSTWAQREGESGWAAGPALQERREEWAYAAIGCASTRSFNQSCTAAPTAAHGFQEL